MAGFQAAGSAPLVLGRMVDDPETVATAIRIGHPVNASKARWAVRRSDGFFEAVTDEAILRPRGDLARLGGLFAEPRSCAPLAGLRCSTPEGAAPGIRRGHGPHGERAEGSRCGRSQRPHFREIDDTREALLEVMGK
jgi:threonine synthase